MIDNRVLSEALKKLEGELREVRQELEERVAIRWQELGLGDLDSCEPDLSLFGYILDDLVHKRAKKQ